MGEAMFWNMFSTGIDGGLRHQTKWGNDHPWEFGNEVAGERKLPTTNNLHL
jgi:hypothetical protein